ncbi:MULTISPECIES: DEAD/DEAH box helicase family protein [Aequorivita]|uniref:DEAD/DEAH box helicase family protein n=1 Tax=Aequorivita iocasae TaxID=2803865 RepID=A0ABX7DS61_9FLAO|nr:MULTISPECIES: DEAD/DEAH box helicase family protein [Aequorivita]QQX75999.1 DEAD/DEAH box helicase family protein [Aequorivita iocasae]UCA55460.1 DEAD/DEAH box helicase family protein [Aequorivita sp. F7]
MLKDCDWSLDRDYKTGSENEPLQFYLDGLANSKEFNLLLGYFSSSAINLLSVGFATFISKGGKMKMVINHLLSSKDKEAIEKAAQESINKVFDLTDVVSLGRVLDEYDTHFFECLAYLIAEKRIEIKVIKPKNGKGIAHYKSGVFSDGQDAVGYQASCNFTYYGLSENIEQLEAFLSWENGRSNKLIKKQLKLIDDYFAEKDEDVEYVSVSEIEVVLKDRFGKKDINELLVQEEQLLKKKQSLMLSNPKLKKTISKLFNEIEIIRRTPRFPYSEGAREYQINAYNSWVANNYKGMFAMATGTGKTITSLNCLLYEYKKTGIYRAIITVPTTALVEQWKKECAKFNFRNIITVSSKENWDKNLAFFNTASKLIDTSYIVIVTYASLARPKFQSYFTQLPKDTILIADETHNLGSQGILRLLPNIHLEKRIGLSATPHRKFDELGNQAIQDFFNDEPPYIVSYSMEEALNIGWLCKYTYHPHIVKLTDQEMEKYKELSLQLLKMGLFDKETGSFRSTPEIEKKLLERKRIIHKASNKLNAFKAILRSEFDKRKNLKYTLIYVPEGIEANFDEADYSVETEVENRLINEYTKAVSHTDDSVMVKQFTANSTNREEILKNFEESKIHVLTSMKCLDEGVDVPRSELAIFCASTGNPRQFIQRRGRVLRLHKDKIHATIHDLVVVPEVSDESTFEMEKGLVKKELERVVDFANLAMNKTATYETLKNILDYYNLNLNDL